MHHMRAWYPRKPEEGVGSPGTGVKNSCKPPMWVQTTKPPVSYKKKKNFLTSEPSLQPPGPLFFLKGAKGRKIYYWIPQE